MRFNNSFHVDLPPGEAWNLLMDIEEVAPAMPGAALTEVIDENTYKGKVSVRMGPVLLHFAGTAQFESRDAEARTARIKATGRDAKGRGGANAVADFSIEADPAGGSSVAIETDLNLSGSVAQYGRSAGVIQAIANQLIDEFARNLEQRIAAERSAAPAADPAPAADTAAGATPPRPAPQAAKPISGFAFLARLVKARLRALFAGGAR